MYAILGRVIDIAVQKNVICNTSVKVRGPQGYMQDENVACRDLGTRIIQAHGRMFRPSSNTRLIFKGFNSRIA